MLYRGYLVGALIEPMPGAVVAVILALLVVTLHWPRRGPVRRAHSIGATRAAGAYCQQCFRHEVCEAGMSDGEVQSILPSCTESQIFNFLSPLPSKIVVRAQIPGKGKAWDKAVIGCARQERQLPTKADARSRSSGRAAMRMLARSNYGDTKAQSGLSVWRLAPPACWQASLPTS